jgi:hypothetical protein
MGYSWVKLAEAGNVNMVIFMPECSDNSFDATAW